MNVGEHVKISHPGWFGDGEIGRVEYFGIGSTGAYVRLQNRQCFRHEQKFLTKVEQPDCQLGCCQGPVRPEEYDARKADFDSL